MSNGTGVEEKVGNMNVEEKKPKAQTGKKGGEKKKKVETGGFPLEVSHARLRACRSLVHFGKLI